MRSARAVSWRRWCDINTASRHQMAPACQADFTTARALISQPQSTTMVGKYLLWLSRSQHTLVLRHLDPEYGSFVGGVSPQSSHAADPGDWGGGGWECECISMFNVRWFCRSPVSTQYSVQYSVVPDDPDGVGTSAADDPWLKAPTASQFHVYLPYRGLMPV